MTTGLATTESTNCPPGGEPALPEQFCAADVVAEPALCAAVENTVSETTACPNAAPNADSWRAEVAARLERYRTRRKPKTPRYPSLLLPFDAPETWSRPAAPTASAAVATARQEQDFAFDMNEGGEVRGQGISQLREALQHASERTLERNPQPIPDRYPEQTSEPSAKVIEFPRSAAIPVFHPSDLADPVFDSDRPRIVEAPEILPPPPALGGMLIEPAHQESADRRSENPIVCRSASIARRTLAAFVDGVVVATALAAFAAIFIRLNPILNSSLNSSLNPVRGPLSLFARPMLSAPMPMLMFAGALAAVAVLLWVAYEFLFVVYTGSTPGLRAARLQLAEFDGAPLKRSSRRWRVLASFLSAFSAGLGYLWCVLDQDGLCWHDRITRTHVQPIIRAEVRAGIRAE